MPAGSSRDLRFRSSTTRRAHAPVRARASDRSATRRAASTRIGAAFLLALVCIALVPGCKLVQSAVRVPGRVLTGDRRDERPPPIAVQTEVMRFADRFLSTMYEATREFAAKAGTPEAHIQGLSWHVGQATSALSIATGPNPNANLLDMIVLVTLGRMVHEEYWQPKVWGDADQSMVDAFQRLEGEIWEVAATVLTKEEQEEIQGALAQWHDEHSDMTVTAFVRIPNYRTLIATHHARRPDVFERLADLISIDPLSGLEPATREVEQTRLFGERTLFYLQRAPLIYSNQAELLGLKFASRPEVVKALDGSETVSKSIGEIAHTIQELPDRVRAEREAALRQVSDELTRQREGIVKDLQEAQEPAARLLDEARTTLVAGRETSESLKGAIQTLDGFVARFDEPPGESPPKDPNAKPFDVEQYGIAAARIGEASKDLTALIASVDESLPRMQRLVDDVAARSDDSVRRALDRALAYGLLLVAAAAIAALLVRASTARRPQRSAG